MNGLIMTGQLILSLAILVTLHEFGHYIAAKTFGIKVEKFYLFFDAWGIKLFKFKKGETEYGIGWLPLGGYVKIAGMIDESMDKDQMKKPPQDFEFRSKPAWQRLIVMIAGVVMNLILGILLFTMNIAVFEKHYIPTEEVNKQGIYALAPGRALGFENGDKIIRVNGEEIERFNDAVSIGVLFGADITVKRNGSLVNITIPDSAYKTLKKTGQHLYTLGNYPVIIDSLIPNGNAQKAGLKLNDQIIGFDNKNIHCFGQFVELLSEYKEQETKITVQRNGNTETFNITVDKMGRIQIAVKGPNIALSEYSLPQAFKYGTSDAIETLIVNTKGLGKVFNGEEKASESVQGPIAIATMFGATWNWYRFWKITALLSMILAFMNILPIPALDGGHAVFALYEIMSGRKPSEKFLEHAQIVGMLILLALMFFAFGNDIYQQIIK